MAKPKSLLKTLKVERAMRAHNCQHNSNHRILKNDLRLGVKRGRNIDNYCVACAKVFIENTKEKIDVILNELTK